MAQQGDIINHQQFQSQSFFLEEGELKKREFKNMGDQDERLSTIRVKAFEFDWSSETDEHMSIDGM